MTIEELSIEYETTYLKLENRVKELKKQLHIMYANGLFMSKDVYYLRKKITIMEDMLHETKYTYTKLRDYYKHSDKLPYKRHYNNMPKYN